MPFIFDDLTIPAVFQGRCLRSGIKFADLGEHYFTCAEKTWVCVVLIGSVGTSPQLIGRRTSALCRRYNLTKLAVKEWLRYHLLGVIFEPGYLDLMEYVLDAQGLQALNQFQDDLPDTLETDEDKRNRWISFFHEAMASTAARRHAAIAKERSTWKF